MYKIVANSLGEAGAPKEECRKGLMELAPEKTWIDDKLLKLSRQARKALLKEAKRRVASEVGDKTPDEVKKLALETALSVGQTIRHLTSISEKMNQQLTKFKATLANVTQDDVRELRDVLDKFSPIFRQTQKTDLYIEPIVEYAKTAVGRKKLPAVLGIFKQCLETEIEGQEKDLEEIREAFKSVTDKMNDLDWWSADGVPMMSKENLDLYTTLTKADEWKAKMQLAADEHKERDASLAIPTEHKTETDTYTVLGLSEDNPSYWPGVGTKLGNCFRSLGECSHVTELGPHIPGVNLLTVFGSDKSLKGGAWLFRHNGNTFIEWVEVLSRAEERKKPETFSEQVSIFKSVIAHLRDREPESRIFFAEGKDYFTDTHGYTPVSQRFLVPTFVVNSCHLEEHFVGVGTDVKADITLEANLTTMFGSNIRVNNKRGYHTIELLEKLPKSAYVYYEVKDAT